VHTQRTPRYIQPGWCAVKVQWEISGKDSYGFMHVRYHLSKKGKIYRLRSIMKRPELVNGVTIFLV